MKSLLFALVLIESGCGPAKTSNEKASSVAKSTSPISQDIDSKKTQSTIAKTVTEPKKTSVPEIKTVPATANIGPAQLLCSMLKNPTASEVSSKIGCRFDEGGKRVPLTAIAQTIKFTATVSTGVNFQVDSSDSSTWDAVYDFSSSDLEATLKSKLTIIFTNTVTGENRAVLSMLLGDF